MAIKIVRYTAERTLQVAEFNRRLRHGQVRFQFPESSSPHWLPPGEGEKIYQEMFLAVDDSGAVRGGYILKSQPFAVDGKVLTIGNYQLPLSEGIVNRAYGAVALVMLADALKRQPRLYCLGMGGLDRPLPKMLSAMGWSMALVPFYYRVIRAGRFLRNIAYLRTSPIRKRALDFLALTGLGHLGVRLHRRGRPKIAGHPDGYSSEPVSEFGDWVDDIWTEAAPDCRLAAVRDTACLRRLYPAADKRFLRLKVSRDGREVGWVVAMATQLKNHKQFGSMSLGSIVDGCSRPGHEAACLQLAAGFLRDRKVDLIVSNQMHPAWQTGLTAAGLQAGPSNFGLALSPALVQSAAAATTAPPRYHFNRGDGDGPINL